MKILHSITWTWVWVSLLGHRTWRKSSPGFVPKFKLITLFTPNRFILSLFLSPSQVVDHRVLSRSYHVRRPRPRLVTMTSEEYDSVTPLPVIPNMRQVRSVDLTPSAPEQRCDNLQRRWDIICTCTQHEVCLSTVTALRDRDSLSRRDLSPSPATPLSDRGSGRGWWPGRSPSGGGCLRIEVTRARMSRRWDVSGNRKFFTDSQ